MWRWGLGLAAGWLALFGSDAGAQTQPPLDPFLSAPPPRYVPPRPANPPPRAAPRPASAAPASGYPAAVGQAFRDCADCPEMMVIPAGRFTMGSPTSEADRRADEGPQHEVTVTAPLAVGRSHVTVGEYRAFVAATGRGDGGSCYTLNSAGEWQDQAGRSWRNPGFSQTDRDPVVCVNWEEAQAYARWLAGRTGRGYRLLTEAEWEYAARAGGSSRWWWGDNAAAQCGNANGADQTALGIPGWKSTWTTAPCSDGYAFTSPAGRFAANAFGLHDMAGNAWQWVGDCYRESYAGAPTEAGAMVDQGGCSSRVLRGGSWGDIPQDLRSAHRSGYPPDFRLNYLGFRVARTPGG